MKNIYLTIFVLILSIINFTLQAQVPIEEDDGEYLLIDKEDYLIDFGGGG